MTEADDSLMLAILKEPQTDMRQRRTMLLQVVELLRRHDRRFDEIERRLDDVERRISDTRAFWAGFRDADGWGDRAT